MADKLRRGELDRLKNGITIRMLVVEAVMLLNQTALAEAVEGEDIGMVARQETQVVVQALIRAPLERLVVLSVMAILIFGPILGAELFL